MGKLEKYSSYKDSAIEWLGEIPEHWQLLPFKSLLKRNGLIRGPFGSALQTSSFVEKGYKVYEQKNAIYNDLTLGKSYIDKTKYNELKRFEINSNDFLMSCSGTIGKLTKVPSSFEKGIINQAMLIIRTKNIEILDNFFEYLFSSEYIMNTILDNSLGSAMKNLVGMPIFRNIKIPLPPKDEQIKIAEFLDEKTSQLDNAISQKEKLIELLKEQKQITINDAVTKGLDKNVEFKDSGVDWIGGIPNHWKLERLGSNFTERKEKVSDKDFEPLSVTKNGVVPQLDNAAKSNDGDNRKLVRNGDFVINSRSDRKGSSGLSTLDGSVSLINIVLKPITINPKFSHILLKSNGFIEEFYRNGHGIVADLWTTRYWDMKSIMLAIPPKDEQIQIVEYIEKQTTKIDKAIELQQNYISKLKEYKASLIDSVVTGKVKVG